MGDTCQLELEDLILAPGSWFAEGSLSMSLMSGATRFLMCSKVMHMNPPLVGTGAVAGVA
jgi:hypothetical protein